MTIPTRAAPHRNRYALVAIALLFSATAAAAQAPDTITRLSWLAGCWEQRTATRLVEEHWLAPAGGSMVGVSRTISRDATRAWEFLRIMPVSGALAYIAVPSGQNETSFPATLVSDTLVVFENPAHDFPQRIAYRRVTADSVVARISAVKDGQQRGTDIPMRRSACIK